MPILGKLRDFYRRVFKPTSEVLEPLPSSPYRTSSPIEVQEVEPPTLENLYLGEAMIRHADDLDPQIQEKALLHITRQRELRIAWDKRHAEKV